MFRLKDRIEKMMPNNNKKKRRKRLSYEFCHRISGGLIKRKRKKA